MKAGNICPKCRANLVRYGISEKAIYSAERMLGYVRSEAIGKPMLFDEDAAFVVMRFSQNDENDVLHLPADLKNWECLTYSKGNFDELKNKVIKFFSDNYHYII